jgi:hypothetical protein
MPGVQLDRRCDAPVRGEYDAGADGTQITRGRDEEIIRLQVRSAIIVKDLGRRMDDEISLPSQSHRKPHGEAVNG